MGRVLFYFSILIFFASANLKAQLLFEENFDYVIGDFSSVGNSNWSSTGYGNEAIIYNDNLFFPDYHSSLKGKLLNISNSGIDYNRSLEAPISTGSIYLSFLFKAINEDGLSGGIQGDYFLHFTSGITSIALLEIRKVSASSAFQLGLKKKTGSTTSFLSLELNYNSIYLIVFSYTFNSLTNNDDVIKLWVNPEQSENIPEPDLTFSDSETDVDKINRVSIRQGTNTPNAYIDGIRVATSWMEAPYPVELTSFTASLLKDQVQLNWHTSTEVNNYGFEVERKITGFQSSVVNWERVAFINGHGNCNSPKDYFYEDIDLTKFGKYSYRLKQIDNDGKFEYSKTAEVNYIQNNNILHQNYPNPFNPSTKICYTISSPGNVKITLYSFLGEKIKELLNEYKDPGNYNIDFSVNNVENNLPSGVYFYKIDADNFSQTRKMLILK